MGFECIACFICCPGITEYLWYNPKRLTAAGRGEFNPVVGNDTAEGKARNRRTEIIITPKLDQFMDLIDQAPDSSSSDTIGNEDVKE